MKRKQFFFILSTCLALSAYSPVSAAEATFSSFEEDETFVSEDEDSFRDENYDIIDDEMIAIISLILKNVERLNRLKYLLMKLIQDIK